ncbi:hypothetical protein Tco_0877367 [Tanacetum coccineum]|uniref:Uncharacterized protein n=1 Tax=Tanacetum coccineum TaxID=301880 RepID=A0ABQ5BXL7_9ASTR
MCHASLANDWHWDCQPGMPKRHGMRHELLEELGEHQRDIVETLMQPQEIVNAARLLSYSHYKEPTELEIQEMVNILVSGEAYDKVFNHLDMLHAPLEGKLKWVGEKIRLFHSLKIRFEDVQELVEVLEVKIMILLDQETPGDLTTRDRLSPKVKMFLIPVIGCITSLGEDIRCKMFLVSYHHGEEAAGLCVSKSKVYRRQQEHKKDIHVFETDFGLHLCFDAAMGMSKAGG